MRWNTGGRSARGGRPGRSHAGVFLAPVGFDGCRGPQLGAGWDRVRRPGSALP